MTFPPFGGAQVEKQWKLQWVSLRLLHSFPPAAVETATATRRDTASAAQFGLAQALGWRRLRRRLSCWGDSLMSTDQPSLATNRRGFLRTGAAATAALPFAAHAAPNEITRPGVVKRYATLGRTGLEISDISFGSAALRTGQEHVVHHALDAGINYFDTAESYARSQSETTLGNALKGRRDKVVITSKTMTKANTSGNELMARLEASLKRLQTDYVDIYMNHAVNDVNVMKNPHWRAFVAKAKEQGKIRFAGMSGHGGRLIECLDYVFDEDMVDVVLVAHNFGQDPKFYESLTKDFDFVATQQDLPRVLAKGEGEERGRHGDEDAQGSAPKRHAPVRDRRCHVRPGGVSVVPVQPACGRGGDHHEQHGQRGRVPWRVRLAQVGRRRHGPLGALRHVERRQLLPARVQRLRRRLPLRRAHRRCASHQDVRGGLPRHAACAGGVRASRSERGGLPLVRRAALRERLHAPHPHRQVLRSDSPHAGVARSPAGGAGMADALLYECFAGISGDMHLGALIDVGVPADHLRRELGRLEAADEFELVVESAGKRGVSGTRASVRLAADAVRPKRGLREIKNVIDRAGYAPAVRARAFAMFEAIAKAEAKIHGLPIERVHFHEVGATDSIADIVGAAIGLQHLGAEQAYCGPVEVGKGTVRCAHGVFPVPAPATAEILKGAPCHYGGVEGEATTPTGAAILQCAVDAFDPPPAFTPRVVGYGIGQRDFALPNALRLSLGTVAAARPATAHGLEVETNIEVSATSTTCRRKRSARSWTRCSPKAPKTSSSRPL